MWHYGKKQNNKHIHDRTINSVGYSLKLKEIQHINEKQQTIGANTLEESRSNKNNKNKKRKPLFKLNEGVPLEKRNNSFNNLNNTGSPEQSKIKNKSHKDTLNKFSNSDSEVMGSKFERGKKNRKRHKRKSIWEDECRNKSFVSKFAQDIDDHNLYEKFGTKQNGIVNNTLYKEEGKVSHPSLYKKNKKKKAHSQSLNEKDLEELEELGNHSTEKCNTSNILIDIRESDCEVTSFISPTPTKTRKKKGQKLKNKESVNVNYDERAAEENTLDNKLLNTESHVWELQSTSTESELAEELKGDVLYLFKKKKKKNRDSEKHHDDKGEDNTQFEHLNSIIDSENDTSGSNRFELSVDIRDSECEMTIMRNPNQRKKKKRIRASQDISKKCANKSNHTDLFESLNKESLETSEIVNDSLKSPCKHKKKRTKENGFVDIDLENVGSAEILDTNVTIDTDTLSPKRKGTDIGKDKIHAKLSISDSMESSYSRHKKKKKSKHKTIDNTNINNESSDITELYYSDFTNSSFERSLGSNGRSTIDRIMESEIDSSHTEIITSPMNLKEFADYSPSNRKYKRQSENESSEIIDSLPRKRYKKADTDNDNIEKNENNSSLQLEKKEKKQKYNQSDVIHIRDSQCKAASFCKFSGKNKNRLSKGESDSTIENISHKSLGLEETEDDLDKKNWKNWDVHSSTLQEIVSDKRNTHKEKHRKSGINDEQSNKKRNHLSSSFEETNQEKSKHKGVLVDTNDNQDEVIRFCDISSIEKDKINRDILDGVNNQDGENCGDESNSDANLNKDKVKRSKKHKKIREKHNKQLSDEQETSENSVLDQHQEEDTSLLKNEMLSEDDARHTKDGDSSDEEKPRIKYESSGQCESEDSDVTNENESEKLRSPCFEINLPFTVPLLHMIPKRTTHLTKEQLKEIKLHNLEVKSGAFSKEEDEKILTNWKNFCERYGFGMNPAMFIKFPQRVRLDTKMQFLRYLSHGLDNRLLHRVHARFKKLVKSTKKGRFSEKEDSTILDYMSDTRSRCPFADLASTLGRTRLAIEKRYKRLISTERNTVHWTDDKIMAFITRLQRITKVQDVMELEHRQITLQEWQKLSRKMDSIPVEKLKLAWKINIYPRLFVDENVDLKEIKELIIRRLIKTKETDWKTVDWKKIAKKFPGFTPLKLYMMFKQLVIFHVPKEMQPNLEESLNFLDKHMVQYNLIPKAHKFKKIDYIYDHVMNKDR